MFQVMDINSLRSLNGLLYYSNFLNHLNLSNSHLREVDVELFGEPEAGIIETEVGIVHHQIDGATTGITNVTAVAVAGGRERQ